MQTFNRFNALSAFVGLLGLVSACGGSQPPPPAAAAPPPPPPATVAPPAAVAPAPAAAPSAAEAAPAAPAPRRMGHGHLLSDLFRESVAELELTAAQKPTVDGILTDLEKHSDVPDDLRKKLESDVHDGVTAGKLDRAKTDADIKAMSTAVAANAPALQEDLNQLHRALTPDQRKKLVETMHGKASRMHEHMGGHGDMHEHMEGHGDMHDHAAGDHMAPGPGAMIDRLTQELALTPAQAEQLHKKLDAQMNAQHSAMKDKMLGGVKHLQAVGQAFPRDDFDAKKVGVGTEAPELVKAMASAQVDFVATVLSVLTPEQRPKLVAHLERHEAAMD